MNKIRVVAAIVDVQNLTLYKEDGDSVLIRQGDHRLKPILDAIKPGISRGEVVEVDLDGFSTAEINHFAKYEEKSGGFAKFFKVAKDAVKKFFHIDNEPAPAVEPEEIGTSSLAYGDPACDEDYALPADELIKPLSNGVESKPGKPANLDDAISEVLAHAVPASSTNFALTKEEEDTHEIVAVVQTEAGDRAVIPSAENLETQIKGALDSDNDTGLKALMARVAAMPKKRNHSVEDLLKFIKRADLPLTNKGDIVIYKILNKGTGPHNLNYVDIHSGRVYQGPGALVRMDETMVDHDRSAECSNGLHVARRSYLRSFGGNVCILGIIRPEDVIAVPHRDANKMRVCAYHLISLLSDQDYKTVNSDNPLGAETAGAKQLAHIIAGNYDEPRVIVTIGGQKGTNLTYTSVQNAKKADKFASVAPVAALEIVEELEVKQAAAVDPKAVAKDVADIKQADTGAAVQQLTDTLNQVKDQKADKPKVAASAEGSPRDRIAALLSQGLTAESAVAIHSIKRKAKKGYDKLGVSVEQEKAILALLPQDK